MAERVEVEIEGRVVALSTLGRPVWHEPQFTKHDLVEYYVRVGPTMLPHLAGHPLTLHRFPEGVTGPHFFQTRTPPHPDWIRTTTMSFERTGKSFETCVIDDLAGIVWAANLMTIELHPFLGTTDHLDRPTGVVFDLDPGAPADLVDCCRVAVRLKALLDDLGLVSLAKSSGGLGLHVQVPLNSEDTYDDTKPFARAVAGLLAKDDPNVVDRMSRSDRAGKVFIDWSQNDPGKSTIVPYSLRAEQFPTVATPVTWEEIENVAASRDIATLIFGPGTVIDRINERGDLFEVAVETVQSVADRS